jgi:hypothetical protein
MNRGEACRCHSNCLTAWVKNPGLSFVTGFGLTNDDGLWCAHSWLMTKSGQIIETTVKRDMYFGIELGGQDLFEFCKARVEASGAEVSIA